ncbi:GGDEF domain-containing protein [Bordetella genomosp. 1]|uniref:diguanylate cyclase n=1 Tax=Bordetella genomosp. 1 TaxID=1395607 RepID=A0ABX4EXC5_9BORD|nr:GGDEF domain-containing protein [Bordetella genomosp. 1]OZI63728.1 GGDEF domain-containing protein [Bordetella genomosp. 1]
MLAPINLLFITALATFIALCVLGSLARSGIAGIRGALAANGLTIVALIAFTEQTREGALWLSVMLANFLMSGALILFYASFRRFLGHSVPWRRLLVALGLFMVVLYVFTYLHWNLAVRIVAASALHFAILASLAHSIWSTQRPRGWRYSEVFCLVLMLTAVAGHLLRIFVYATGLEQSMVMMAPTLWNVIFLSLGVLVMPSLTLGFIMMIHDRMLADREREANIDFLTGVLSRKAWWSEVERLGAQVRRGRTPLALLILDIDHFKRINDTIGHPGGDAVLRHFASLAATTLRASDVLGRLGGEEFVVALPGTALQEARLVAERMLAAVAAVPCRYGDKEWSYTFSAGLTRWDGVQPLQDVMERADRALYAAKQSGRNRVVVDTSVPV